MLATFCLETYFLKCFSDISFSFPGPHQTALGLKKNLPKAKNQPDATALTENDINWLKN